MAPSSSPLQFHAATGVPVVCTAGRSYHIIRGDGRIYRCMYCPTVLGSIHDASLPQLEASRLICTWKNNHARLDDTCHPSGDLMFASWWENDRMHEAPWPWWDEAKDPRRTRDDATYLMIFPVNSKCNLACPFCCNYYTELEDGRTTGRPPDHTRDLPLSDWMGFADRMSAKITWAHWAFLGGEPTLYHELAPLVRHLVCARGWEVGICSNMMRTQVFCDIVAALGDGHQHQLQITASLHPSSPRFSWHNYLSSVALLRSAGYLVRATLVAWPEQTYMYDVYQERLAAIGVPLRLKACGGYKTGADGAYIAQRGGYRETFDELREIGWLPPVGKKPNRPPCP